MKTVRIPFSPSQRCESPALWLLITARYANNKTWSHLNTLFFSVPSEWHWHWQFSLEMKCLSYTEQNENEIEMETSPHYTGVSFTFSDAIAHTLRTIYALCVTVFFILPFLFAFCTSLNCPVDNACCCLILQCKLQRPRFNRLKFKSLSRIPFDFNTLRIIVLHGSEKLRHELNW